MDSEGYCRHRNNVVGGGPCMSCAEEDRDAALERVRVLEAHIASYADHAANSGWHNLAEEIRAALSSHHKDTP